VRELEAEVERQEMAGPQVAAGLAVVALVACLAVEFPEVVLASLAAVGSLDSEEELAGPAWEQVAASSAFVGELASLVASS
jgi:hypothetical protein